MKSIKNCERDRNDCVSTGYINQQHLNKWGVINYILLLAVLFSSYPGFGQSAQSSTGSSYVNQPISGSSAQWLNMSNCILSDNVYSVPSANLANTGDYTDYLVITNFLFTIPSGSTISGISVSIENSDVNGKSKDDRVRLIKNGVMGSIDKSKSSAWGSTDLVKSYGGGSDLWGNSWTTSDVNSFNFGVAFSAERTGGGPQPTLAKMDQIYITVYYNSPTPLPVQLIHFDAKLNNNSVQLSWQTASEVNNDFFTVLKSTNGLEFYEIQKISGAGSSSNLNSYHYTDHQISNGISYYRLQQTDFDGKTEFFKAKCLLNLGKKEEGCRMLQIASGKKYPEAEVFINQYCK